MWVLYNFSIPNEAIHVSVFLLHRVIHGQGFAGLTAYQITAVDTQIHRPIDTHAL